jgi:hypothetical protein
MGRSDGAFGERHDVPASSSPARSDAAETPVDEIRTGLEDDKTLVYGALDQSPVPIAIYDAQLRVVRLPAAVVRRLVAESPHLAGFGERDLRGQRLTDLLPGNPVAERATRYMRRAVETGEEVRYESFARAAGDIRERAWVVSHSPIKDTAGRVVGLTTIGFDVSEQARERLALLYEASTRIGSTLDVTRTAKELAEVAVPGYADWASVDLLDSIFRGGDLAPGQLVGPIALRRAAYRSSVDHLQVTVALGQVKTYPEFLPLGALPGDRPSCPAPGQRPRDGPLGHRRLRQIRSSPRPRAPFHDVRTVARPWDHPRLGGICSLRPPGAVRAG